MQQNQAYHILAFYYFTEILDPHGEVKLHKDFFSTRDITSRIYISEKGINGQMSGSIQAASEYMEWMHGRKEFSKVKFKIDPYHEHVFPRQTVKYRKQIVALDEEVNLELGGIHLSPEEWKKKLETKDYGILIDTRNDYEWEVGRFDGAELPNCSTFREFNAYADALREKTDPKKTPVMMYCTGGIRCELYSAALKARGFDTVYQLDGGIINYGHKVGNAHWEGKLFVFDDRLTTPISKDEHSVIGKCHFCKTATDDYYNCANIDCNRLYLCCKECLHEYLGCCQSSCKEAPRLRQYHQQNPHKPFRRLSETRQKTF